MFKGNRWLIAGVAGAVLVTPGVGRAQGAFGQSSTTQPGGASPAGGAVQAQGSFKAPPAIRPGQPISVLVFPFGYLGGEEGAPAADASAPADASGAPAAAEGLTQAQSHLAAYLTASVKAGFLASPYFAVASFHPTSALVQRAQKDDVIKPEHLAGLIAPATGSADTNKARTLTYRLGMQALLSGSIDVKSDPKANTSEVTLETQLIDSTTGEVIRSAAVSGAAAGAEGVPLSVVEERAALDAAQKVLPAMGIELVALPSTAPDAPKARGAKGRVKKSDADGDAKKAAEAAKKAEAAGRRAEKDAAEKAARAAREQEREAAKAQKAAAKKPKTEKASAAPVKVQQDDAAQASAAPAAPAAGPAKVMPAAPVAGISTSVPATANAAGQPVPYGYALGESSSALPQRDRKGLRVPPWMGVVGFLYGLSFLVF